MSVEHILSAHVAADGRVSVVANIIRQMLADSEEIDRQQFLPAKGAALKRDRRALAQQATDDELRRVEAGIDERTERAVAEARQAQRQRALDVGDRLVDVARIDRATSPAEIAVTLGEAESVGAAELRRVWNYARPVLERMERANIRMNRLPSGTGALTVLTRWQVRVAAAGRLVPDEATIRERGRLDKASLRARVAAVAQVAGLTVGVARAVGPAAAGVEPKGGLTFGRYWDMRAAAEHQE